MQPTSSTSTLHSFTVSLLGNFQKQFISECHALELRSWRKMQKLYDFKLKFLTSEDRKLFKETRQTLGLV